MKKNFQKFKNKGFTLVEIVVAISIFSVLIFVTSNLLINVIKNPKLQLSSLDTIDQARMVASNFTNEMRSAAYGTYPLVEAGDYQIVFYSTVGAVQGNVNKIKYYAEDNVLYKGITTPVDGVYDPESEVIKPILTGLANGINPLFYYYDGEYDANGIGSFLVQPVNINNVKFVEINLQVKKNDSSSSTFLVKSGATIRILKDNLSQ